jgi:outer membrane protein assembly factor BamB
MRSFVVVLLFFCQCYLIAQAIPDFRTQPKVDWKFSTRGAIVSSPVIEKKTVFIGSADSTLYAINVENGKVRWKYTISGPIKTTICVEGDRVFLTGGDGVLYCFSKNTGHMEWTFRTRGEKLYELYSYADYYHSSPTLHNGVLFFGSGDSSVYAVRSSTGELLWSYKTDDVVHSSPVVDHEKLIVGSFDGNVYALRCDNGGLIWKFKTVGHRFFPKGELQGSPVIGNGLVYIGGRDYNVYAIDEEKGYCHWNRVFPLGWATALSCRDTILYVGTSDDDVMMTVDGRTGKELWKTDVQFNIFGPCAFTDSMLYFGTLMGKFYGLDLRTGTIQWSLTTDGYNAHHALYFKSEEEIVKDDFYAIVQTPEGYIRALHELGAIFSRPAISKDHIIVASTDGMVYCFGR